MSIVFINTRPINKAHYLTEYLINQGIQVIELPLLQLQSLPINQTHTQTLQALNQYQVVVCVSPAAVEMVKDNLHTISVHVLNSTNWVAVGETTQNLLYQQGIKKVHVPSHKSNEGMLQLPIIQNLQGNEKVLILRGQGGRRLLIDKLLAREIQVDSIELYTRQRPNCLISQYQTSIPDHKKYILKPVVLISSGESWQHWLSVCNNLQGFTYVVLGERIARILAEKDINYQVIDDLLPDTIYNTILKNIE